jgi:hypothetical protein
MADRWLGWFRRHGHATWEQAVQGDSVGACVRKLLRFIRDKRIRLRSSLDRVVTSGAYPCVPPREE